MTIDVKFMKKLSIIQVIGHKNQVLISSKTQKRKKTQKIKFSMVKMHTETISLKTKRIYTSTQTTVIYTILIQKKKPSATQKTHRLDTSQKRPEEQQKVT